MRSDRRTFAAAVTPLRDGGASVDLDAIPPYTQFLARSGLHGVLTLGTTGEGILLSLEERQAVARAFLESAQISLAVIVHCGAQTTRETCALSEAAAAQGAAGVAVIGPPYFTPDDEALFDHFSQAARACAPAPFYLYEFRRTAGYSLSLPLLQRLREGCPNLRGMKCSNTPWEHLEPYLLPAWDVFVGAEALLLPALERDAAGAVSGLAAAFPECVVEHVRHPDAAGSAQVTHLRAALQAIPFHAAQKVALAMRGIPIRPDVRGPLRGLNALEQSRVRSLVEDYCSALPSRASRS
ncbi:MAG: dihydrodipicolinate synthase family protein [Planctomycetes bacterium]|nr:dihydrodipicolinate synthase family protein [Planctomycetota bacterium]